MNSVKLAVAGALCACWLAGTAAAQPILNRVEQFLRDQVQAADAGAPAEPGYLGLMADESDEAGRGVQLLEVYPDQPAAEGGLEKGDLIVRIDEQAIGSMDDMARAVEGKPAGAKLVIVVERNGAQRQLNVTLGARPRPDGVVPEEMPVPDAPRVELPAPEPPGDQPTATARPRLGVRSMAVTEDVRRLNNLPEARGAHVVSVTVDSPAHRAGIPLGAVVTSVDETPIDTPEKLAAAIRAAGDNVRLTYFDRGQVVQRAVALVPQPPAGAPHIEVRGRPPAPFAELPDDESPDGDAPALEPSAQQRVRELERRVQVLEERLKRLEAELARDEQ